MEQLIGLCDWYEGDTISENENEEYLVSNENSDKPVEPLNQILFGPPGTGKTFATTELAVKIADSGWYKTQKASLSGIEFVKAIKQRYDDLVVRKQVVFTTFHQSFAYEDFIEGIRAGTDEQTGALRYDIQDGIFKQLCEAADVRVTLQSDETVDLAGRRIWKMSLGNTLEDDDSIYQECLENNYALLGYGNDIDFSDCNTRNDVKLKLEAETGIQQADNNYTLTSVHTLKNVIRPGDILVVSDGNHKFRAVGEFNGEYQFLGTEERSGYQQMRPVKWLKLYEPSLPKEQLFKKSLSQMTLYELRPKTIDHDKLSQLLAPQDKRELEPQPHVIIIDEINRGNISRILGELITLLEPSKRKGGSDARSVTLPYSKVPFRIPENVYVIGTMNTADKSLAQLDLALRRRFTFVEIPPDLRLLNGVSVHGVDVGEMLNEINQRIDVLLDKDHLIGHSYFLPLSEDVSDQVRENMLADLFRLNIIPLLKEYFFDDWERIGWVLNDAQKNTSDRFITHGSDRSIGSLFSSSIAEQLTERRFEVNYDAFHSPGAYQGIIMQQA
jgi:5-methylcytosine-specific restriction protein B